jgi:hypothetical protein
VERSFIVKVLAAALGPAASAKAASLEEVVHLALSMKKHWETRRFRGVSLPMAAQLLRRGAQLISGKKSSKLLGTVGAAATGGVNTWLMMGVIQAGMSAYRERFLLRGIGKKKRSPRASAPTPSTAAAAASKATTPRAPKGAADIH